MKNLTSNNLTKKEIIQAMKDCEQFPNFSVQEHCLSVYNYYCQLDEMLSLGIKIKEKFREDLKWKLPDWFFKYEEDLAWNRYSSSIMYWYLMYHDCGKPYCLFIDDYGNRHFPNHSTISSELWLIIRNDLDGYYFNELEKIEDFTNRVQLLIFHDMDLHLLKSKDIDSWLVGKPIDFVISLLLAALAEIHSNGAALNSIDSIEFKIKWKRLNKIGKIICNKLFSDKFKI